MIIEISKNTGVVAVGGALVAAYYLLKNGRKWFKRVDDYRNEVLDGRNLDDDIQKASISNSSFTVEERCDAKKILVYQKQKIQNAMTRKAVDEAVSEFDRMVKNFTTGTDAERGAEILFLKEKIKEEQERQKEQNEIESERRNTEMLVSAIKSLNVSQY